MFAGWDPWLLQWRYQLVWIGPLVCSGWLQVHLESVLKSELVQNGNAHVCLQQFNALKHITPLMAAEWKAKTSQASRAPLKPPGNENMTVPSKRSVLITLRGAAMWLAKQYLGVCRMKMPKKWVTSKCNGICKITWTVRSLKYWFMRLSLRSESPIDSPSLPGPSCSEVRWSQMAYGLSHSWPCPLSPNSLYRVRTRWWIQKWSGKTASIFNVTVMLYCFSKETSRSSRALDSSNW